MSHSKFNGSRNVLTLLSVKMTERDMRRRSHRGGLLGRYYHSSGSLEKLTPCITNWDWTARPLITWCSFQRHANRIFFFLSMNQWLHPTRRWFLWCSRRSCTLLNPLTNLQQSRCSALDPLVLLPPFSYGASAELCLSVLWWQSNIFLHGKQAILFFLRAALHQIHIILQRAPFCHCSFYLHLIPPLYCPLQIYTHIQD